MKFMDIMSDNFEMLEYGNLEVLQCHLGLSINDLESHSTSMEADIGGLFLDSITDHSRRQTEKYLTKTSIELYLKS